MLRRLKYSLITACLIFISIACSRHSNFNKRKYLNLKAKNSYQKQDPKKAPVVERETITYSETTTYEEVDVKTGVEKTSGSDIYQNTQNEIADSKNDDIRIKETSGNNSKRAKKNHSNLKTPSKSTEAKDSNLAWMLGIGGGLGVAFIFGFLLYSSAPYRVGYWAKHNPNKAKALAAASQSVAMVSAVALGYLASESGIESGSTMTTMLVSGLAGSLLFFPKKSAKTGIYKSSYFKQKMMTAAALVFSVGLLFNISNRYFIGDQDLTIHKSPVTALSEVSQDLDSKSKVFDSYWDGEEDPADRRAAMAGLMSILMILCIASVIAAIILCCLLTCIGYPIAAVMLGVGVAAAVIILLILGAREVWFSRDTEDVDLDDNRTWVGLGFFLMCLGLVTMLGLSALVIMGIIVMAPYLFIAIGMVLFIIGGIVYHFGKNPRS